MSQFPYRLTHLDKLFIAGLHSSRLSTANVWTHAVTFRLRSG
jgi:hypothetical protein